MTHHPRSFLSVSFTLLALCALTGCLAEDDPPAGDPNLATSTPVAGDDGRYDFERTTAKIDPGAYGTYDVAPIPGAERLRLSFHYANGVELSEDLILRSDGAWQTSKSGHTQITFPYQALDGVFSREWSTTVGGLPVGGGSDPELTVGKFVYIEFSAGKRFHYRNTTSVTVTSYIGGQMGGRVYQGTDFLNQVAVNEGGTYHIEDNMYLVLTFDSGPKATAFFRFLPSVKQSNGGSTGAFMDWGKHRYACPGTCVIE